MKTSLVLTALALCVLATTMVPLAASHHGGWDCYGADGTAEVCVARTFHTGTDCLVATDVLGNEQIFCW